MLYKQTRYVLRVIRSVADTTDETVFYFVSPAPKRYSFKNSETGKQSFCEKFIGEIDSIVDYLVENGYLVNVAGNQYCLTQRGIHPFMIEWKKFQNFLFRSIFTPIAVSVATTFISLWLTGRL